MYLLPVFAPMLWTVPASFEEHAPIHPKGTPGNPLSPTRNYYTHWSDELRDKILDGQSLIYAIARLRSLIRVLYLDAIGIPQKTIYEALVGARTEAQFLVQIRGAERRAVHPADTMGAFMHFQRGSKVTPNTKPSGRGNAEPVDNSR